MKILVPLDGSPFAESILTHVHGLIDEPGSEIHLLFVVEATTAGASEQASGRRALEDARAALGARAEVAHVHLAHGRPAERITDRARALGVDLIAMATHGRSGVTRLLRGSVAEAVLRAAPVPMYLINPTGLVGRAQAPRFPRVLVALDGSKEAEAIVPLVGRFAGAWGADVVLLHVDAPGEAGVSEAPESAALKAQERAVARLGRVQEALLASDVRSHVLGLYGDPAACIVRAADEREATLVAMTTAGRSGLRRLQFGSVAEEVLRRARTPLLVSRGLGSA